MRTIDQCKSLLQYRCTKAGYNGNISPNNFNLIFGSAEQRYYNRLYKTYGIDQDNTESLSVFKSDPLPIAIDAQGKYSKPEDILHVDSIRSSTQAEIVRYEDDRLGNKLSSTYDAPTSEFPIYIEYKTYLQFYPVNISNGFLVYLEQLVPSVWAYTLNGNGRPVYDEENSVQPKWRDDDIDKIIYMCMSDLGLNMRDPLVTQFADIKTQTEV